MIRYKVFDKKELVLETNSKKQVAAYIKVEIDKIDEIIRKNKLVKKKYHVVAEKEKKSSFDKDISEMIDLGFGTDYGKYKTYEKNLLTPNLYKSKKKTKSYKYLK